MREEERLMGCVFGEWRRWCGARGWEKDAGGSGAGAAHFLTVGGPVPNTHAITQSVTDCLSLSLYSHLLQICTMLFSSHTIADYLFAFSSFIADLI